MDKFTNKGSKPTKSGFGEGVFEAAHLNKNVIGIGVDITSSVGMDLFAEAFPERFISLGIAEQNAVGVSAGLALSGKTPVFSTYAVFSAMRTTDFIRVSVCYNNLHVIIGGAHAGISVGPDGATHQALEDIAIMRVLPNMTVLSPADATQAKILTMKAIEELDTPVYIRFGRESVPDFTSLDQQLEIGKGQLMRKGIDVCIIATGHMVWESLKGAEILKEEGVFAEVINIHTIKPIDKELIINAAKKTNKVITVEEHQVNGGLGGAVAEVLSQYCPTKMKIIGFPDRFGESGQAGELMEKYGLTSRNIANEVLKFVDNQ